MAFCVFIFIFLFKNNVIRKQLDENDFRLCYVFFPESIILKVLDHSYVQSSLSTIMRQLDNSIWKTPYNWIFYGHWCQAGTKTFNLLFYASLSVKQAWFLNLTNVDPLIFATIFLPFYLLILYLEVYPVPLCSFHKSQ